MADVTISVAVTVPASLSVGQTAQAVARVATDVNDAALDAQSVVWASSNPTVASVDASGLVKAVTAGSANIKATVGTVFGIAPLAVSSAVALIDAAAEAVVKAVPVGSSFVLRGPNMDFAVQVTA